MIRSGDDVSMAQGRRLKAAREAAGYRSARAAALENSWVEGTYRSHETGRRTIGLDDAEKYARRFRVRGASVTAKIILFGDDKAEPGVATQAPSPRVVVRVPVLSWVSAGRLADASTQVPAGDAPLVPIADLRPGEYFALKVSGDSMDRVSPDGSVIVIDRGDRQLKDGKFYVFAIGGETTFKMPHASDDLQVAQPLDEDRPVCRACGKRGQVRRLAVDPHVTSCNDAAYEVVLRGHRRFRR